MTDDLLNRCTAGTTMQTRATPRTTREFRSPIGRRQRSRARSELNELQVATGTVDEVIANWTDVSTNGASTIGSEATGTTEAAALISWVHGLR